MNEFVSILDARTVVSILSLIPAIVFGFLAHKRHQRKSLIYEVISFVPVFSVSPEWKDRVKILFDDKPVNSVHLVVIKLMNAGNTAIMAGDYEEAINVDFGEEAEVLTAEVAGSNPEGVFTTLTVSERSVALGRVLMNAGDWVTIKFLVCQPKPIKVGGRVVGVQRIKTLPSEYVRVQRTALPILSMLVLFLPVLLVIGWVDTFFKINAGYKLGIAADLFLVLICGILVRVNAKAFSIAKRFFG